MSSKILSMTALQRICRESKGTDGIRCAQLVRALQEAGLSEAEATITGADFFRDFDTLHRGVLSVKLFLDNYKLMTTLAVVKDLLSTPGIETVSLEQLTKVLATKLEEDVSARQAQQMFDALDTDRSGSISTDELVQFRDQTEATIQRSKDANVAAAVRETFDRFDCNGAADGKLDSQEFRHLCASLGEILSDADHQVLYNRVNTNGDGITYEQFSSWFLNPNRASSGQQGVSAAVLRARLMASRGNNWLRTLVSKSDAKSATGFSGALEVGAPFEDINAILSANLEEFHLDDDHKNWLGAYNGAAYIALDFQTTQGEFIESILQPIVTLFNKTVADDQRAPRLKVTRPSHDTIRCSVGLRPGLRNFTSSIEQAKPIIQGARVDVEFPRGQQDLAENFNTLTVGDLLACRLRVAGNVPPAELRQMAGEPVRQLSAMLGTGGLPILADVIDGKTGDLGLRNIQHLLTPLLNQGGAEFLEHIKKPRVRAEKFFVKTSDGRYMNSSGGFDSEKHSVSLSTGGAEHFNSAPRAEASEVLPRYTLQQKCSNRYAKLENGRWVGSETKAFVCLKDDAQKKEQEQPTAYFQFRHVASGRYACKNTGGNHFGATTDEPSTLEVKTDLNGLKHIRAPFQDGYMRHFQGDYDNFTQSNQDADTACRFDDAGNGRVFVCNPRRGRLSVHLEGKLFFPNLAEGGSDELCLWELIETTKPPPQLPANHRIVTLRNRGNGRYAAKDPNAHWTTTSAPTRLLFTTPPGDLLFTTLPGDAFVHIRQLDNTVYMRHYGGDADNFGQGFTDRDTAWHLEGNASDGYRFHNTTRENSFLAVHGSGKLYVPNGSDGANNDAYSLWDIAYDVPREFPEEEKEAAPETKRVHIRAETEDQFMRHFDGDHDNFTQTYTDRDTHWDIIAAPGGQPNEFIVKHGNVDRYLRFDSSAGILRVPLACELSDEEKVWILTEAGAAEEKVTVVEEVKEPSEPDRFFSIVRDDGQFLMHRCRHENLNSQSYADYDTAWKASYADGAFTLVHRANGYLTEHGTVDINVANAVKVTFEAETFDAEGDGEKQNEPATFLEWKIKNLVQSVVQTLAVGEQRPISYYLLVFITALRVAGVGISEVTALHGRLANGFGATLRARGISNPAGLAALLQRVFDLFP